MPHDHGSEDSLVTHTSNTESNGHALKVNIPEHVDLPTNSDNNSVDSLCTCNISFSNFACSTLGVHSSGPLPLDFITAWALWTLPSISTLDKPRAATKPLCMSLDAPVSDIYVFPQWGACNVVRPSRDGSPGDGLGPDGIPDGDGGFATILAFESRNCVMGINSHGQLPRSKHRRTKYQSRESQISGSRWVQKSLLDIVSPSSQNSPGYGCWEVGFSARSFMVLGWGQAYM